MTKFAPHGDFDFSIDGRVLISKVAGPFNAEFARAYMRAITPIIHTLAESGPWGGIAEFSGSALFPLEMSALIRSQAIIAVEQLQMVANCWVVSPSVEGYGIVDKQARRVYGGVLPFEIFENSADARVWMDAQLRADNPFDLQRFIDAQNPVYDQVCSELHGGQKRGHWMWFIFPQIEGLGHSALAEKYAIASRAEALAYLRHPVLGPRLYECSQLVTLIEGKTIRQIFGTPDDLKFRSSMTLFTSTASDHQIFGDALNKYFAGERDPLTLARL